MASSDAKLIPVKGQAWRVYFPMQKNDGTIITGWTSASAMISKDGGTAASTTNTPTEIASSFGIGYLDLTSTEMNATSVQIKVTVTNSGAIPTTIIPYTLADGRDIPSNPTYWNSGAIPAPNQTGVPITDPNYWKGQAAASVDTNGYPVVTVKHGTGTGEIDLTSGQVKVSANNDKTNYGLADGAITSAKIADNAITAAKIASNTIDADALASDAVGEIAAGVLDAAASAHNTSGTIGARINAAGSAGDPLASAVPGSYAAGTAGFKLGGLGAGEVTLISPVNAQTGDLEIISGDDYTTSSGRALPEWSSESWSPYSLTTAQSISFRARTPLSETVFEKAAAALSDTQVRVELTAAETGGFSMGRDAYRFDLQAVLASGDVVTLAQGKITIIENVH